MEVPWARRPVLTVDDDEVICEVISEALGAEGYPTDIALNGQAALKLLQQEGRRRLIITDNWMPIMGGADFLQAVRTLPGHEQTPVVLLSASTPTELAALKRRCSFDDVLAKPFVLRDLTRLASRFCGPEANQLR